MPSTHSTVTLAALALFLPAWSANAADCRSQPAPSPPPAAANDNRNAGGTVRDGVLAVRLVIREASWYPDGPGGCSLRVHAFAEEGKRAEIPGPVSYTHLTLPTTERV